MKLHLPLALRAALLAVLCATQVWAERTLTIDGVEKEDWDGIIAETLQGTEFEITLSGSTTNTAELQSGGYIARDNGSSATITVNSGGEFTQSGGIIACDSGSSATITVNGGKFTSKGTIAYGSGSSATITVNGGEFTSTEDYLGFFGSVTIDVKGGGKFSKSGGYIRNGTVTVEDGGTFTLSGSATIAYGKTMTVNGDFVQKGGKIDSYTSAEVIVGEGGVYAMSGGTNATPVTVNQGGSYALSDSAKVTGKVTLKGGRLDLGGLGETGATIVFQDGTMSNAQNYAGILQVETDEETTKGGALEMGGIDGSKLRKISVQSNKAGVSLTNFAAGSTLTLSGENTMTLGSANASETGAMFQFADGNGTLILDEDATITFRNIGVLKTEGECWLTNASTVTGWAEALRIYELYGFEVSLQQEAGIGWKLTATGLDQFWVASFDGTKVVEESRLSDYTNGVIADQGLTLTLTNPGTTQVHNLTDAGTKSSFSVSGAGGVVVELVNSKDTTMGGDITVTGGAELHKTGTGAFIFSGTLSTDGELVIQEGSFNQSGGYIASDSGATITVENDGTFTQSGGYIAYEQGSNATITVNGGGRFTQDASVKTNYIAYDSDSYAEITVNKGGLFEQKSDQGSAYIAYGKGSLARINVDGGTFTQQGGQYVGVIARYGSADIEVSNGGEFTQETGGCIAYASGSSATITVNKGGTFRQSGGYIAYYEQGSNAMITVNGGEFTSTGGDLGYNGSVTIDVKKDGNFSKSGGYIRNGTVTVEKDGTFTLSGNATISYGKTMTVNGNFVQEGGTIDSYTSAEVIVGKGGVYTMSGGTNGAPVTVNQGGSYVLSDSAKVTGEVTLKGGSLDLGGLKETDATIIFQGGAMSNAQNYAGILQVETDEETTGGGALEMGGIDGSKLRKISVQSNKAGVSLTNFAAGSTLTLSGEDTMTLGSANLKEDGALFQFADNQGQLSFAEGSTIQLTVGMELYKELKATAGKLEVWLTNAQSVENEEQALKMIVSIGSVKMDLDFSLQHEDNKGWKLVSDTIQRTWFASIDGTAVTEADHLGNYDIAVVADQDLTLTLENSGTTQVHNLTDGGTKGGFSVRGDGGVVIELVNSKDTTMGGDITVTGGIELRKTGSGAFTFSGTLSTDGELVVQEGSFNQSGGYIAKDSGSSATITVNGKGTFTQSGGYIAYEQGSNATITVNGGGRFTQDASKSNKDIAYDSDSYAEITVNTGGLFEQKSDRKNACIARGNGSQARIYVNGGKFTQQGGDYFSIIASYGSAYIEVSNGGEFTQETDGVIANVDNSSATITVKGGGTFTQNGGYIARGGDYGSSYVEIKVEDGGTFTQSGGYIAKGGDYAADYGGSSYVEIKVEDSGTFTQSGGYIAYRSVSSATITVDRDGEFTSTGGYLGYRGSVTIDVKKDGNFSKSGGYIMFGTITVEDGGKFTLSGDADISYGETMTVNGDFVQEGGTFNQWHTANLTIKEGGVYAMSGGTYDVTTTVNAGGNYNYSGGTIGSSSFTVRDGGYFNIVGEVEYTHSTALKGSGHITVNDSATYDLEDNEGTLDIIMRGGSLANAGSYAKNVRIDTGADYSGEVSLGGLDAARIESVTIAGAATSITDMASGSTLSFHKGDSITVGSEHMSEVNGDAPDGGYILNFTDGTGTVAFAEEGAVVLNFTSDVLEEALDEGDIRKEIWLTNGTIDGVPTEDLEGWLKQHFVLGPGWKV